MDALLVVFSECKNSDSVWAEVTKEEELLCSDEESKSTIQSLTASSPLKAFLRRPTVFRKEGKSGDPPVLRATAEIAVPSQVLADQIWDLQKRNEWDPKFTSFRVIESDQDKMLAHIRHGGRDATVQRVRGIVEGTLIFAEKSVLVSSLPPTKNLERQNVLLAGFAIESLGPDRCRVSSIAQVEGERGIKRLVGKFSTGLAPVSWFPHRYVSELLFINRSLIARNRAEELLKEAQLLEQSGDKKGADKLIQEAEQLMQEAELATKEKKARLEMRRQRRRASSATRDQGPASDFDSDESGFFSPQTPAWKTPGSAAADSKKKFQNILETENEAELDSTITRGQDSMKSWAMPVSEENVLDPEALRQEQMLAEVERAEKERSERDRLEKKQAEKLERERAEQELVEKERAEKERMGLERLERERVQEERLERERVERERLERERAERERIQSAQERARLERERAQMEQARMRLEKEQVEKNRMEREKMDRQRLEEEQAEKDREERKRVEMEDAELIRAERERVQSVARLEKERELAERTRVITEDRVKKEKVEREAARGQLSNTEFQKESSMRIDREQVERYFWQNRAQKEWIESGEVGAKSNASSVKRMLDMELLRQKRTLEDDAMRQRLLENDRRKREEENFWLKRVEELKTAERLKAGGQISRSSTRTQEASVATPSHQTSLTPRELSEMSNPFISRSATGYTPRSTLATPRESLNDNFAPTPAQYFRSSPRESSPPALRHSTSAATRIRNAHLTTLAYANLTCASLAAVKSCVESGCVTRVVHEAKSARNACTVTELAFADVSRAFEMIQLEGSVTPLVESWVREARENCQRAKAAERKSSELSKRLLDRAVGKSKQKEGGLGVVVRKAGDRGFNVERVLEGTFVHRDNLLAINDMVTRVGAADVRKMNSIKAICAGPIESKQALHVVRGVDELDVVVSRSHMSALHK